MSICEAFKHLEILFIHAGCIQFDILAYFFCIKKISNVGPTHVFELLFFTDFKRLHAN